MSQSSRLGIIVIGVALLLLGNYLYKKEGFQTITPVTPPPTTTNANMNTNNESPPIPDRYSGPIATATGIGDVSLYTAHKDILNKYVLIKKNKLTADVTIAKYIDSDAFSKINYLYNEVKAYIDENFDMGKITNMPEGANKQTLQQIIYTTNDQVTILYYIYYTFPSIVIASNAVIDSDSANAYSTMNEDVIAASVKIIMNQIAAFPSSLQRINTSATRLQSLSTTLTNNSNEDTTSAFITALNEYVKACDNEIINQNTYMTNLNSLQATQATSGSDNTKTKYKEFLNTKILFLQNAVNTIQSIQNSISKIKDLNPIITTTISSRVNKYNEELMNTKNLLITYTSEGFQSYGNPYVAPSPSLFQAHQFRLDKRSYVDEVFSNIKLW